MRTEQISPRYVELDSWSVAEMIAAMYEGQLAAAAAVRGALPAIAAAQEFEDVQPSTGILSLKQQGSFFIGGNTHAVPDPYAGVGTGARPGNSMINQMYVQFQKPARSNHLPPIVFVHGCCLSSKTWETTPDGRMGWYEYFTRKGFDTYMADQVGRARSGFDALQYQKLRYDRAASEFADDGTGVGCVNGASPPGPNPAGCLAPGDARGNPVFPALPGKTGTTNPSILIATDMFAWNVFRYGPPCTAPCGAFTSPPTMVRRTRRSRSRTTMSPDPPTRIRPSDRSPSTRAGTVVAMAMARATFMPGSSDIRLMRCPMAAALPASVPSSSRTTAPSLITRRPDSM